MYADEIVLPETKPETEWVRGRALQKVSPKRRHARLQGALFLVLARWAAERGEIGIEWRFRLQPAGEVRRPLVPDLSFVTFERLQGLVGEDLEAPPIAPDVAIEILSPGDRRADVTHKIGVYLACGTALVLVVDPRDRSVVLHDARGHRRLVDGDTIEHAMLPEFTLGVTELFVAIEPPRMP
ncbi:MAG: Uma2 family endonuclease [Candidatus Dormibacteria bacterium]